jgi:peptidoglycan/LPS O-acetylase OafA/YrhL
VTAGVFSVPRKLRLQGGPLSLVEAFDPRANSIGFLRWLMAFLVIFSHAGPIAGFYGGHDLGVQISSEQSIGGVAVAGFFFFSGFLIARSRMGSSTIWRYLWRRCLRIFPAFWATLLLVVLVFAPIAWWHTTGSIAGYWGVNYESPLTYFFNNMWLDLGQRNIAGMGAELPYSQLHGGYDWNGSAWTLRYEFLAYIVVAVLGLFGALANRMIGGIFCAVVLVLNAMQWSGAGTLWSVNPIFSDPFLLMFLAPFCFGVLFTLFGDRIPVDDRLAIGALAFGALTYAYGGWNVIGQFGFLYFLMWFAVRGRITNWEKHGDFSYGIYITAWPVMTLGAFFGLQDYGWMVYHVVVIVATHVLAYLSWHLIESPAMSLKNWTPRLLERGLSFIRPATTFLREELVNPDFSSTPYASRLRKQRQSAEGQS